MTPRPLLAPNPVPQVLVLLLAPLAFFEVVLFSADMVGPHVRNIFVQWLGVWPELWGYGNKIYPSYSTPVYPGQSVLMVFTYGLIHASPLHLIFNAIGFLLFGRALLTTMSLKAFLTLLTASIVGGGVAFILLNTQADVAVGLSGGVYGLGAFWAGLWMIEKYKRTGSVKPAVGILGVIFFITVVFPLITGGVAWQAHLGGALVGLFASALYLRKV